MRNEKKNKWVNDINDTTSKECQKSQATIWWTSLASQISLNTRCLYEAFRSTPICNRNTMDWDRSEIIVIIKFKLPSLLCKIVKEGGSVGIKCAFNSLMYEISPQVIQCINWGHAVQMIRICNFYNCLTQQRRKSYHWKALAQIYDREEKEKKVWQLRMSKKRYTNQWATCTLLSLKRGHPRESLW